MPEVHLFGGEKGGIGKSFICAAAVSYLLRKEAHFALFDCDRSNPNIKRMHDDICRYAVISENVDNEGQADMVLESGLQKQTLVNLPAQSFIALKKWFEENSLLQLSKDVDLSFRIWFVSDGGFDSMNLLANSVDFFQEKVPHVLLKNYGVNRSKWGEISNHPRVARLSDQFGITHVKFPRMAGANTSKIDQLSLSFLEAAGHDALNFGERQRVATFLRESGQVFDELSLFDIPVANDQNSSNAS